MATELRAKLVIDAETEGAKSVEALAIDVEKLAEAGGDAAPSCSYWPLSCVAWRSSRAWWTSSRA